MKTSSQRAKSARLEWPRHAHPSMLIGPNVRIILTLGDGFHHQIGVSPRRLLIHFSCLSRTALSKDKQDDTYGKLVLPQYSADTKSLSTILTWMTLQATPGHKKDIPLRWDGQTDDFAAAILLARTAYTLGIPRVLNETFAQLHAHISEIPLMAQEIQLIWDCFGPTDPLTWRMAHQTVFLWEFGRLGDWDAVESYAEKNAQLLEMFANRWEVIMEKRMGPRLEMEHENKRADTFHRQ